MNVKEHWDKLNPSKKKLAVIGVIIASVLLIAAMGYKNRGTEKQAKPKEEKAKSFGLVDQKYLDKNVYDNTKKVTEETNQKVAALAKENEEIKKQFEAQKKQTEELIKNGLQSHADKKSPLNGALPSPPPLPAGSGGIKFPPSPFQGIPGKGAQNQAPAVETIGDIVVKTNSSATATLQGKDAGKDHVKDATDKKKEGEKLYLPPSFMPGTLLTGLLAPATGNGKGDPVPVLIRVNDLAILPNKVKANLKGCFVIAEGRGDLAKERADLRLVSLSCLSKQGQSLIDQKIKGFVVDADDIVGLHGNVVSKMGSTIARAALAGFIVGIGDAFKTEGMLTTVTGAGVVQTMDTENMAKKAIGSGLSDASKELQKFYLDLAKQTLPVIEVLGQKQISLVVSEGVELTIKDLCKGGEACKN